MFIIQTWPCFFSETQKESFHCHYVDKKITVKSHLEFLGKLHPFKSHWFCNNMITFTHLLRAVSWKRFTQYCRKPFKSILLTPPMGLISALEQSYFVKYPVKLMKQRIRLGSGKPKMSQKWKENSWHLSSTFAEPRTNKPPGFPWAHRQSWAKR